MSYITAHDLNDPDPRSEIALLKGLMFPAAQTIQRNPRGTGMLLGQSLRLVGLLAATGADQKRLLQGLGWVKELGVARFTLGQNPPSVPATLTINRQTFTVPSGASADDKATTWSQVFGAALILRDTDALAQLCRYDPSDFVGGYDGYHISIAAGLMAMHTGSADCEAVLAEALKQAQAATMFPEWGRLHGVPAVHLAAAVRCGEAGAVNAALRDALECHRALCDRPESRHLAQRYLPLLSLGLAAMAHDAGIPITVESDYLPPWLAR